MKYLHHPLLPALMILALYANAFAENKAGFFLPDSIREMTMKYRSVNNLIILPVVINDSVKVNLILDTGCRNLVLFGRRFQKLLPLNKDKEIIFSGLGSGAAVKGNLALDNTVSIHSVLGNHVPIVVVADRNLFGKYREVDGVIGYEIFLKFEIEINPSLETITFRPASRATAPEQYTKVPLEVVDSRPVMRSDIFFGNGDPSNCDLMIDTGSSIGLLLKTTDVKRYDHSDEPTLIGMGLNGKLYGYQTKADKLSVNGFEIAFVSAGIIESDWHNNASIGMGILKDYIIVLNYCQSYACFKKIA
jgi:hypothetical protein